MNNKGCTVKRILAMILLILLLLPAAPAALAESYSAAVTPEKMPVYADRALTKKLTTLKRYTIVSVEEIKNGVAEFTYEGYTLYAKSSSLKAVEDFATLCTVNKNTRVYTQPDTESKSVALKKDAQVYLLATSGSWAMIEQAGNVGYTYAGHLTPEDTYAEPEETLPPEGEDFGEIITCEIDAVVTAASLKVYKKASTASQSLGSISFGQKVTVHAYNSEWAYIELKGNFGFCALSGLAKAPQNDATAAPTPTPKPEKPSLDDAVSGTVTVSSLPVYASASTSSRKLGTLKYGAEVNVVEYNSTWAYIELNGNFGYCLVSSLTPTSQFKPEKPENDKNDITGNGDTVIGTATVIMPGAPVYASASTDSRSSALSMGQTLDVYAYNSDWVRVALDGKKGYVQRKNLNMKSYTELATGDSGSAVRDLEDVLLDLGYLDTAPSASYTTNTSAAVRRLQAACGLTETGNADEITLRIAFSGNAPVSPLLNTTLALGAVSSNVTRLQTRLYALGYLSKATSMDGEYGNNTVSAVKLFQSAAGLSATGTADITTINALYKQKAPSLPSGLKAPDAGSTSGLHGSSYIGDMPAGTASFTSEFNESMSNAEKLEYVIYVAQNQLGKPYVYGTAGTATFDCSGYTSYCFKQINVKLKRSAYAQGYDEGYTKVSDVAELKRGDQVYFNTLEDSDLSDHVGIYLGNNYFLHASSGAGKIVVSDLSTGYYKRVYSWGHHILET